LVGWKVFGDPGPDGEGERDLGPHVWESPGDESDAESDGERECLLDGERDRDRECFFRSTVDGGERDGFLERDRDRDLERERFLPSIVDGCKLI